MPSLVPSMPIDTVNETPASTLRGSQTAKQPERVKQVMFHPQAIIRVDVGGDRW